jgi:putative hydrolase of the HAD superfamily
MLEADVRAVAFDAVGTLIHPDPPAAEVYAAVGRRFGSRRSAADCRRRFAAAFGRQEALDRVSEFKTDAGRELLRWRAIVGEVLDDATDPEACFHELYDHFARPQAWRCEPETAAVLDWLGRRGYALVIASNYDARLRPVVTGMRELGPVRHLVISSEVGWRKPAAAFFAAVCRSVRLPPHQVLFLGDDRENDHDGALSAGLRGLLLDPDGSDPTARRVTRLADLLGVLPESPTR